MKVTWIVTKSSFLIFSFSVNYVCYVYYQSSSFFVSISYSIIFKFCRRDLSLQQLGGPLEKHPGDTGWRYCDDFFLINHFKIIYINVQENQLLPAKEHQSTNNGIFCNPKSHSDPEIKVICNPHDILLFNIHVLLEICPLILHSPIAVRRNALGSMQEPYKIKEKNPNAIKVRE